MKRLRVSIPFIAGQWSLHFNASPPGGFPPRVSIPFIAGQWSLHLPRGPGSPRRPVSIPFIAGQWSLRCRAPPPPRRRGHRVSIPFIAGQWSLPAASARARSSASSFNPLHCGAVVASNSFRRLLFHSRYVSIPFIAGQWSLRVPNPRLER